MSKGILISFEGPDGAGKTTVLERVVPILQERLGRHIITTREPGGVAIAESIRDIILDVNHQAMDAKTELLLYIAARRQHLVEKVLPHVEAGDVVLVDRFIDSSVAYQGYGRGLDKDIINCLNHFALEDYQPDMTLLFDVSSEVGLARIHANSKREVNRLDLETIDMHQRVRQGYLDLAKEHSERIVIIDATLSLEKVIEAAQNAILARFI